MSMPARGLRRSWLVGDESWCEVAERLLSEALTAVLSTAGERLENTPRQCP